MNLTPEKVGLVAAASALGGILVSQIVTLLRDAVQRRYETRTRYHLERVEAYTEFAVEAWKVQARPDFTLSTAEALETAERRLHAHIRAQLLATPRVRNAMGKMALLAHEIAERPRDQDEVQDRHQREQWSRAMTHFQEAVQKELGVPGAVHLPSLFPVRVKRDGS